MIENAAYIKVEAHVRYWDDAYINGEPDEAGDKTPFREGDLWCPVIRITDGVVEGWSAGVEADFHFKVCDAGTYHLLDSDKDVIASRHDDYVPNGLCHGDKGYGDYIIFAVDAEGSIKNYRAALDADDWEAP